MRHIRCAIYTRKSSEDGLEQSFNSLDAQREACAAYVLSQASEGWVASPAIYEDGGLSGGTLTRPGLKRLLSDVEAGKIDIIVVYKVDRLTRSLLDFAKLVEAFDTAGTSFVSVTQSFNTTNSMGRLTLNMLLSFAQFEREVTAERIRDKLAASKAKGMWMGGIPPMGYAPNGRSLKIIEQQARLVRDIYRRYLELGTVRQVVEQLEDEGIRTPARSTASGKTFGDRPLCRGHIFAILRNPIYVGDIAHKDKLYPGQHEAIIDRETWAAVQEKLASHVQGARRVRRKTVSPLAGRVVDEDGKPLIPAHSTKGKTRYRYYVSKAHHHREDEGIGSAIRVPAVELEKLVAHEAARLFEDPLKLVTQINGDLTEANVPEVMDRSVLLAKTLAKPSSKEFRAALLQIKMLSDGVSVALCRGAVAKLLGVTIEVGIGPAYVFTIKARIKRSGRAVRFVQENGLTTASEPDLPLIRLIAKGRAWWRELSKGELDIATLSKNEGVTASWMTRVVRLAFLSPAVVEAALDGKLRAGISSKDFVATGAVPACWQAQAARYLANSSMSERIAI